MVLRILALRSPAGQKDAWSGGHRAIRLSRPGRLLGVAVLIWAVSFAWPKTPLGSQPTERILLETESPYHYVRVVESGGIRRLQFRRSGQDFEESAINVRNPLDFPLNYYELMMAGFVHQPNPKRILFVGLGGGTLPRAIRHYYPTTQIDIIELDPVVVDAAKKYFGFVEDERTTVYIRDARVQIRRLTRDGRKYDIIFLDAFRGGYIPYHLTTKEFLELVRSLLEPNGVVVSNLQPGFVSYHYQRRTMASVFANQWAYGSFGNVIVVNSMESAPPGREELLRRAEVIQERRQFNVFLPGVIERMQSEPDYDKSGPILTDDFAPTDVLRSIPQE